MNYLYLGLGDLYLPAVAAAIHLEKLPSDRVPDVKMLARLPHFVAGDKDNQGVFHPLGKDSDGNEVFITQVGVQPELVWRAIMSLVHILGSDPDTLQVRLCVPENPQVAGVLALLGRLGLSPIRDYAAIRLVKNRYRDLVAMAKNRH